MITLEQILGCSSKNELASLKNENSDCSDCSDCRGCSNCRGCRDCMFSKNQTNVQFMVHNVQLTKNQYEELQKKLSGE